MSALIDSAEAVSEEDSLAAREAATEGGLALVELDSLLRAENLEVEDLAARTAVLLDNAELALERAFQLNPFDTRSRLWLAQVYGLQARRLGQEESYGKAVDELEKLTLLTPDQHSAFAMLANNYFFLSNWDGAVINYRKAEDVYLETFDLVAQDPEPLDSTLLFSYARAQGDMHVKRLDADRASTAYARALGYALASEDSAYIVGELEWMAWDDMNISSSLARDSLLALEQAGELAQARTGYVDLLTSLTSRAAVDETEWRLSILEYNLGDTEPAAERLLGLVERTPTDDLGVPLDSTHVRYFDDYGRLCLNLGRAFRLEERDSRTALKYFTQATRVNWSGRAVAYFEVARLVQGNVTAALENADMALQAQSTLTDQQRGDLYRLLMELYRRVGDFDRAREFRDAYRELRGG
jgi:Tfp pilus assembly protein PilF